MMGFGFQLDYRNEGERMLDDQERYFKAIDRYAKKHELVRPEGWTVGCGAFGCVWKTTNPQIVIKATTDKEEVAVARMLREEGPGRRPEGIVAYYHEGKALGATLLWREAADVVGQVPQNLIDEISFYQPYASYVREAFGELTGAQQKKWKAEVDEAILALKDVKVTLPTNPNTDTETRIVIDGVNHNINFWHPEGVKAEKMFPYRFVIAWKAARLGAKRLAENPALKLVGEAAMWAMERGFVLADVWYANLGRVWRGGQDVWVIVDPGYTLSAKDSLPKGRREMLENPRRAPKEALYLFHGTNDPTTLLSSQTFDVDRLQSRDHGYFESGFYLAETPEGARSYGKTVLRVRIDPKATLFDGLPDVKSMSISPNGRPPYHQKMRHDWIEHVYRLRKGTKTRAQIAELFDAMYDPESPEFDRLGWYKEVTNWIRFADVADGVVWGSETIILNPKAVIGIERMNRSRAKANPSASTACACKAKKGEFTLPVDHLFAMKVPRGGSSCGSCVFVSKDGKRCGNVTFQKWMSSTGEKDPSLLPAPANQYCCDVYQPAHQQNPTDAVSDEQIQEWMKEFEEGAERFSTMERKANDALAIFTMYWIASQAGMKEDMDRAEQGLTERPMWYDIRVSAMSLLKGSPKLFPNAWKMFMALLQQRCLPPAVRRKVEAAVRSWSKSKVAIRAKQRGQVFQIEAEARAYLDKLKEIREQLQTAKQAYSAPVQCAGSESAKDLRMEAGPFTIVNSGGFSEAFMLGSAEAMGQASVLLKSKGLDFVCYGEAHMVARLDKATVVAQYIPSTDTFLVRGFKKGNHESVGFIIHELGHRLIDKFMSDTAKKMVEGMYRTAHSQHRFPDRSVDISKYLPKIGDEYVEGKKTLTVSEVRYDTIKLKLKGHEDEKMSFSISTQAWAENQRVRAGVVPDHGFINKYAGTSSEENFCEMLRYYCMGKLTPARVEQIEPVLKQAIEDASSLPSRNPADPLDVQVDRFLASGEMRVYPQKYLTMFANHAVEIGQPAPVGEMLGCGGFGCVWPTTQAGVAMKATKDDSEPAIVRKLMSDKKPPPGFVRYTHVSDVNGFTLLWREEIQPYAGKEYASLHAYQLYSKTAREIYEWAEYKDEWNELVKVYAKRMEDTGIALPGKGAKGAVPAHVGTELVDLSWWEPSDDYEEQMVMRFVAAWRVAILAARELRKSKAMSEIADAILWAMSKGIMLCDVSYANLGWATRGGKKVLVIYDPGHTVDVPITKGKP